MSVTARSTLSGAVLDGRYRIEGVVAHGGMSTVYRGTDLRLERTVAIKVMDPALASDPQFLERFSREARAVARVNHVNVVAVYDQGNDGDHVFLVMEYVPGQTLRKVLTNQGVVPAAQALTVMESVLAGLSAAHRKGLVHRDVKPENILIGEDGTVRVVDFGLARAVETTTITQTGGPLLGTVAYLAPEQIKDSTADARTDVYAAGTVLFEMLTGSPPFDGDTAANVAYRHVHEDVPPPSTVVGTDSVPAPLDELVGHATARDPGARPVDAGAFLSEVLTAREDCDFAYEPIPLPRISGDVLTEEVGLGSDAGALDAPPPVAAPEPQGGRPSRRRRHRLRMGILVAFLLLIPVAIGVGLWWISGYTPAPRLVGLPAAEAEATAQGEGFAVEYGEDAFSETVPRGSVAETSPEPGDRTREGATILLQLSKGKERYAVPQLAGQSQAGSERQLDALTLGISNVESVYHDTIEPGQVVTTRPEPGTQLRRDDEVVLVVSKGPAPVELADYTGEPAKEAAQEMREDGLKVEQRERFDNEVEAGVIVAQAPPAGTVKRGDTVSLVVSKGPEIVTVPNLSGVSYDDAAERLEALGLEARKAIDVPGGSGMVLQQSPGAGTEVEHGSTVSLFIF